MPYYKQDGLIASMAKRKAEPARWSKPYDRWTAKDWRAEGMTRDAFVELMRDRLNDLVFDLHGSGSVARDAHRKLSTVAQDALAEDHDALQAYRAWFNTKDKVWNVVAEHDVAVLLLEQIENASKDQILTYASNV